MRFFHVEKTDGYLKMPPILTGFKNWAVGKEIYARSSEIGFGLHVELGFSLFGGRQQGRTDILQSGNRDMTGRSGIEK